MEVLGAGAAPPAGCGRAVVDGFAGSTSIALLLVGVLDPAKEAARLQDKQARLPPALSGASCGASTSGLSRAGAPRGGRECRSNGQAHLQNAVCILRRPPLGLAGPC